MSGRCPWLGCSQAWERLERGADFPLSLHLESVSLPIIVPCGFCGQPPASQYLRLCEVVPLNFNKLV